MHISEYLKKSNVHVNRSDKYMSRPPMLQIVCYREFSYTPDVENGWGLGESTE